MSSSGRNPAGSRKLWQPDGTSIQVDRDGTCTDWCEHSHCATHESGLYCPTNLSRNFPRPAPMRCLEIPKRLRAALDSPLAWTPGLLHGKAGRGKSHRAVRMLADPANPAGGRFVGVLAYLEEMCEIDFDKTDPRWAAAAKIKDAPRLVLDDLGSEKLTEFGVKTIYNLIDYRWGNDDLQTLVTSNLSPTEISAMHGDRIASRIFGFGPVRELAGPDRRLQPPGRSSPPSDGAAA